MFGLLARQLYRGHLARGPVVTTMEATQHLGLQQDLVSMLEDVGGSKGELDEALVWLKVEEVFHSDLVVSVVL